MESEMQKESNVRSLLKALSWRVIATITTILIAWLVYRDIRPALAIGGIEFFAKFLVYYLHERLWQIVPRERIREAPSTFVSGS
ncbi:MAG: DUF2061 domain-containing protein [Verrucomicrobiota bacterium]|nr:DUF2061 domain-containing protein [Verrucomicrobiota bacterium]